MTVSLWNTKAFVDFIYGKLVGDKGYISKNLFQRLFVDGIQLITKLKSNMKGALMSVSDRLLLRKRAIIETVMMSLRILRRWSTPDIDALTISLSIYWVLLLPIVCSQRSRVSMYKGLLTHSLLCSKFVELTLIKFCF